MKPPDPEVVRTVRQWLEHADEDLRFAQHGFSLSGVPPHRLITYHAQQCAEKHLKAYLVFHAIDFPYTHNLSRLLELCAQQASWVQLLRDVEELTPFAVTTRYPGIEEKVSEDEAHRAVEIAARVRQTVRRALEVEGFELPEDSKA